MPASTMDRPKPQYHLPIMALVTIMLLLSELPRTLSDQTLPSRFPEPTLSFPHFEVATAMHNGNTKVYIESLVVTLEVNDTEVTPEFVTYYRTDHNVGHGSTTMASKSFSSEAPYRLEIFPDQSCYRKRKNWFCEVIQHRWSVEVSSRIPYVWCQSILGRRLL